VHVGKTLTDLQILGCELHQNAFGGRTPPGPAPLAVIRRRQRERIGIRERGKGVRKGVGRGGNR